MQDILNSPPDQNQVSRLQAHMEAQNRIKGGAGWFWWIAGLSIANSVLVLANVDLNFLLGLGITLFIDAIAKEITKQDTTNVGILITGIAFVMDAIIAGMFVLFGFFAKKGHIWSFIVGMILYALDGLIFVAIGMWLSVGFHVFALVGLYGGLKAAMALKRLSQPASSAG